jgi:hypothetical protein
MGVTDKMWDATATVIRMNDKVEQMAAAITAQQRKIESLTERVIRLETALEVGFALTAAPGKPPRRILRKV